MSSKEDKKQLFGSEKHGSKLEHFIWSCTRAYPVEHAFSLGDGNPPHQRINNRRSTSKLSVK
jgi:hypothetical protein